MFGDTEAKLKGTLEMDKYYLGGKEWNKQESKKLKAGRHSVGKTVPTVDNATLGRF